MSNKVIIEEGSNVFYANGIMFDSSDSISEIMRSVLSLLEELNIEYELE